MKKLLLFAGLLSFAASCVPNNPGTDNEMKTERLTYFSFDHHNTMSQCGERYAVSTMDDGRVHVVIDEGSPEEKEFYLDDAAIFDELLDIVKTYKMDKYKESYQSRMMVHDGDSWSLYYKYDSGRSVSSGGYMAWPKNYREARQALSGYFQKWRAYRDGVLELDYFQFTCKNNKGCDIEYTLERGATEATVTLRDAERGVDKTFQVGNAYLRAFQQTASAVQMKSKMYDYRTDDENATRCTYLMRYNNGDTVSGVTCYTEYQGPKERAIFDFFSRWMSE